MTRPPFCLAGSSDQLRTGNSGDDEVLVVSSSPKWRHWQQVCSRFWADLRRKGRYLCTWQWGSGWLELLQPPAPPYRIRKAPLVWAPPLDHVPHASTAICPGYEELILGWRGWEASGDTRRAGQSGGNCRSQQDSSIDGEAAGQTESIWGQSQAGQTLWPRILQDPGLGHLRKSPDCFPSCRRIPDSTLVLTILLEERGQDGARNGHRGTLW